MIYHTFSILVGILAAFVFSVLWGWFVVPATGLQPISVGLAYGLLLTYGLLSFKWPWNLTKTLRMGEEDKELDKEEKSKARFVIIFSKIMIYLGAWGIGWVVNTFFM